MYKLKEFVGVIEEYAPLIISRKAIESGDYDNSGIIAGIADRVEKILFSLDLSVVAVKEAISLGADTIVTHHPAIYHPIKNLLTEGETAALTEAVKNGINVVSMHLNLDMAEHGIDFCLAEGLGAKRMKILQPQADTEYGYGREFDVCSTAEEFKENAEKIFRSKKIILYGTGKINRAASFCGGGSDHALSAVRKGETNADIIVSSDMPHHVLKELIERDKKVMIIPHYVSEQYGFKKFYEWTLEKVQGRAATYYFEDKRFM